MSSDTDGPGLLPGAPVATPPVAGPVLGLDTATPAVAVALLLPGPDGSREVIERVVVDARAHGEQLAPGIRAVLAEAGLGVADLAAVAVGVGPGPFTGLRVGVVTAAVLADTLGIPVRGVGTSDVLAADAAERILAARAAAGVLAGGDGGGDPADADGPLGPFDLAVAIDARRREVFFSTYRVAAPPAPGRLPRLQRLSGPMTAAPAQVATDLPTVGAGPTLYPAAFPNAVEPRLPSAGVTARWVAEGLPSGPADPVYLRRPDAVVPGPRKRVLG